MHPDFSIINHKFKAIVNFQLYQNIEQSIKKKLYNVRAMQMAAHWKRKSFLKLWPISLTKRWNGILRMSSSVDF